MSVNWVNGLDMLTQNGVLNYDAASYLMGTPSRYTVNPGGIQAAVNGPIPNPYGTTSATPSGYIDNGGIAVDKFNRVIPTREKEISRPLWKKILWGGVLLGTGAIALKGIMKAWPKILNKSVKSPKYQKNMTSFRQGLKNNWNSVKNFIKHPFKTTKSAIKKHPKLYKFCSGVKNFFTHPWRTIKGWFKKNP